MSFGALIVDDDAEHARRVHAQLESLGAQVSMASEHLQARNRIQSDPFDLVILKSDMPDMDGRRTLPQLRASGWSSAQAPCIATAPSARPEDVKSHIRAGFYTVLRRPAQAWRVREAVYALGLADRPMSSATESLSVLDALSNPMRLQLYGAISRRGEATVTILEEDLGASRQKLDHHFKALFSAGLLATEKRGRETWYSVRTGPAQGAAHWILEMADQPAAYAPA